MTFDEDVNALERYCKADIRHIYRSLMSLFIRLKDRQGVSEGCAEFGTLIYNCDRCSCKL